MVRPWFLEILGHPETSEWVRQSRVSDFHICIHNSVDVWLSSYRRLHENRKRGCQLLSGFFGTSKPWIVWTWKDGWGTMRGELFNCSHTKHKRRFIASNVKNRKVWNLIFQHFCTDIKMTNTKKKKLLLLIIWMKEASFRTSVTPSSLQNRHLTQFQHYFPIMT